MKRAALILAALAAILTAAAAPVRTATENFVTNKIAEAVAAIPSPDFTTNNAALVETIEAKAPAPGNYATVSNRAMTAMQSHQSLQPSTNYTDAALAEFAATGAVARAATYGTPTRWTDATGCVWEVRIELSAWSFSDGLDRAVVYGGFYEWLGWPVYGEDVRGTDSSDYAWFMSQAEATNATRFVYVKADGSEVTATRTEYEATNLVGRVAMTNDIPDTSGYATPADVTAAIREQSLGGIWDETLQVWWTPRMRSGSLTYEATTNVNLNAEN